MTSFTRGTHTVESSAVSMTALPISEDNPFQVVIAESNNNPVSCFLTVGESLGWHAWLDQR